MYKARVQLLEPIKMDNVPENFRLMPGMTATAEIKVGNRRVIEYFSIRSFAILIPASANLRTLCSSQGS